MKQRVRFSLGKKLTTLIVAMAVVLGLVAAVVSYRTFSDSMTEYYNRLGTNLVRTLASQLKAEDLGHYHETGEVGEA